MQAAGMRSVRGGASLLVPAEPHQRAAPRRSLLLPAAALVFALALVARLYPVLQGGGLNGLGNYDDAVHYAATVALVNGELPYRDFLLLHPPGILLLLSPAALLGGLVGDPTAMALARLSWMALGGLNALLVGAVLLRLGASAAAVGALGYAVFFPAIYSEHTVLLESPATTGLLVSLVLLRATEPDAQTGRWRTVLAGAALGATITLKIWGVVPVFLVLGWLLLHRGRRDALRFLAGGVGVCVVICLPFFLSAPGAMWRMVVVDQVGRRPLPVELEERLSELSGMVLWADVGFERLLGVALVLGLVATVVTLLQRRTRLLGALLVVLTALLMLTPSWFLHYSALIAAPAALVLGAAAGWLVDEVAARAGRTAARWVTGLLLLLTLGYGYPLLQAELDEPFPGRSLAAKLAPIEGCIATDDPGTLIQTDTLRRNLDRGCRVEIDLGGVNYHIEPPGGVEVSRARNPNWQAYCLDYYRSADAVISVRFRSGFGYSRATARIYNSWPEAARVGRFVVRTPQPDRAGG